jgi:excisionase family DNA binding protein
MRKINTIVLSKPTLIQAIYKEGILMAKDSTAMGRGWVKATLAAQYCNVSKRTFYGWIQDNPDFPARRQGGSILVHLDRLDAWLLNRRSSARSTFFDK